MGKLNPFEMLNRFGHAACGSVLPKEITLFLYQVFKFYFIFFFLQNNGLYCTWGKNTVSSKA